MSMHDDARPMPEAPPADSVEERHAEEMLTDPDTAAPLDAIESRVLGCLLEKAQTTPDHYPLTLNSLAAACNQKSNREPVLALDDEQITRALETLGTKRYASRITMAGSRVPKYKHTLEIALPKVDERGTALLTVLLLRGQQTLGELRTRTERMFHFPALEDCQAALDNLAAHAGRPLVSHLPAGGGRRVLTFVHLLSGGDTSPPEPAPQASPPATPPPSGQKNLATEVEQLKAELATLREEFDAFRAQFS